MGSNWQYTNNQTKKPSQEGVVSQARQWKVSICSANVRERWTSVKIWFLISLFSQCIVKCGKRTFDSQASSFICLQPKIIEPVWEEGGDCYQVRESHWLWSSNLKPIIFVQKIIMKLIIIVKMLTSPILISDQKSK